MYSWFSYNNVIIFGMIKQLSKVGNSHALIIDKTLMELCHLEAQGSVDIQVEGGAIIIRPARSAAMPVESGLLPVIVAAA